MGIIGKKLRRLNGRTSGRDEGQSNQHGSALIVLTAPMSVQTAMQPDSGSAICDGLALYHDASDGIYFWRQTEKNNLQLTVYQFGGTYLSLAIGMDEDHVIKMRHAGRLSVQIHAICSRAITAFLRLNVQIDGRQEQMHQTLIFHKGERTSNFDLDGLPGEFGPIENAWLDLIFIDPQMVEITLSSLRLGKTTPDYQN